MPPTSTLCQGHAEYIGQEASDSSFYQRVVMPKAIVSRVICYVAVTSSTSQVSTRDDRGDETDATHSISSQKNKNRVNRKRDEVFRFPPTERCDTLTGRSAPATGAGTAAARTEGTARQPPRPARRRGQRQCAGPAVTAAPRPAGCRGQRRERAGDGGGPRGRAAGGGLGRGRAQGRGAASPRAATTSATPALRKWERGAGPRARSARPRLPPLTCVPDDDVLEEIRVGHGRPLPPLARSFVTRALSPRPRWPGSRCGEFETVNGRSLRPPPRRLPPLSAALSLAAPLPPLPEAPGKDAAAVGARGENNNRRRAARSPPATSRTNLLAWPRPRPGSAEVAAGARGGARPPPAGVRGGAERHGPPSSGWRRGVPMAGRCGGGVVSRAEIGRKRVGAVEFSARRQW